MAKVEITSGHYTDVIMATMASQITSLIIVYSTVYTGADQRKHQSPASLAFVRGIHRGPVNSPHKWPVTRKMFPFDDVIMRCFQGDQQVHDGVDNSELCRLPGRLDLAGGTGCPGNGIVTSDERHGVSHHRQSDC